MKKTFTHIAALPFYKRMVALAGAALLFAGTVIGNLSAAAVPEPAKHEAFLTRIISQLMTTQHYTRQQLDDDIASQIFQEYFDTLDTNRRFFLKSDIVEFGKKKEKIDDFLQSGNLEFAFEVYERLLQRVRERVEYARERLKTPFDFSVEETVVLDRTDAEWAESKEALDEIWRKELKNRILTYMLMEEEAAENDSLNEDGKDTGNVEDEAGGKEEGEEDIQNENEEDDSAEAQMDPVQRTLGMQERYLRYLEENESIEIAELFLSSMTRVFDPHSTYMAPATEEDFDINMSLSLEGIGAVLTTEQGYVKIVSIVPGGPADKDGELHEGDRIIAVKQEDAPPVDVIDMPLRKVVQLIRGPKGTTVVLTVLEADKGLSGVPTKIDIVRDEVQLKAQEAKSEIRHPSFDAESRGDEHAKMQTAAKRNGSYMVLSLPSFYSDFKGRREGDNEYKSASRDVHKLLEEATEKDVDGVVLDLRGNGGGSLEEAIKIAGFFFDKGPVVQVRNSFGKVKVYNDPDDAVVYEGPLVVLVDRLSASASEIVAAAIQDHHRGVVIGETSTHGKGTVQTVLELNRFIRSIPEFSDAEVGSLKFTIAKFYRVNGESTQRRGVIPDIAFPSFTDHMELGEASLEHALAWDTINDLAVDAEMDVRPYLPSLKECAAARLESNPRYSELLAAVERFAELRARKELPLDIDQRRKMHKNEEEWLQEVREKAVRRSPRYDEDEEEEESTPESDDTGEAGTNDEGIEVASDDLILEEALRVISDLAWMHQGELIADPDAADTADTAK
mgnify:CR=1 FL=1